MDISIVNNVNKSDELAMYIFVNTDLNMGKGKIAGQVGHVVQNIVTDALSNKHFVDKQYRYLEWSSSLNAKIILKATHEQLLELQKIQESYTVRDAGRTQIEPGSLTVVGFFPNYKSQMYEITKDYKLL